MKLFFARWGDLVFILFFVAVVAYFGGRFVEYDLKEIVCTPAAKRQCLDVYKTSVAGFLGGYFFTAWMLLSTTLIPLTGFIRTSDPTVETKNKTYRFLGLLNGICAWITVVFLIRILKIIGIVLSG